MKKLLTLILICAATLLFSGCGTAGFSLGMSYNEWGATVTFMGTTPVNVNAPVESNPKDQTQDQASD